MTPTDDRTGLVDVHAHFVSPTYIAAATAAGIDHPDAMPGWPSWTAEEHLDVLDEIGVARAILSISSPGIHFGDDDDAAGRLAVQVNDFAADVSRQHPGRFGFFASLPLPDVDATLAEIDRAYSLGATGVAVETNTHGTYIGSPANEQVWDELDRRHAVVFVHPTSPPAADLTDVGLPRPMLEFIFDTTRAITDLIVGGTLRQHPNVQVITPHCGAALPLLADRTQFVLDLLNPAGADRHTTDFTEQLTGLWFDVAGFPMPVQIPALLTTVSPDHLLFGSDYCWTSPAGVRAQIASLDQHWDRPDNTWRATLTANATRPLNP